MHLRTDVAGAHAGVVPAIKQAVRAVALGIIEAAPRLAMLAASRRLAGKQAGCPGAVMRLQVQSIVRGARGQLQQPVRQSSAVEDHAGTVCPLPKAEDRRELLAGISVQLG